MNERNNAHGGVGETEAWRGEKQSIKHLHHRRCGTALCQIPASQTKRCIYLAENSAGWLFRTLLGLLSMPSALVPRINIRCGAPRAGDFTAKTRDGCEDKQTPHPPPKKRGGRHMSGMNVWLIREGVILSGGVKSFKAAAAAAMTAVAGVVTSD